MEKPYTSLAKLLNCHPDEIAITTSSTTSWFQVNSPSLNISIPSTLHFQEQSSHKSLCILRNASTGQQICITYVWRVPGHMIQQLSMPVTKSVCAAA